METRDSLENQETLIQQVEDAWMYYCEIFRRIREMGQRKDVDLDMAAIRKQVDDVYREFAEIGELASVPEETQRQLLISGIATEEGLIKQYAQFKIEPEKVRDILLEAFLDEDPGSVNSFFAELIKISDMVGVTSAYLYKESKEEDSDMNRELNAEGRPYAKWYQEAIEKAQSAYNLIGQFFDGCIARCEGEEEEKLLKPFLEDWKKSIQLYVVECINIANGFVGHLHEGNCAILCATVPFNLPKDQVDKGVEWVLNLERFNIYRAYNPSVFKHARDVKRLPKRNRVLYLPTFVSVIDVLKFLEFFERFWQSVQNGLEPERPYTIFLNRKDPNVAKVKLKGSATLFMRSKPYDGRQARMSIIGEANNRDFAIRVDRENRGNLSLDIGGVHFNEALAYALDVGNASNEGEIIMRYDEIIGPGGEVQSSRKQRQIFVPSVMKSNAKGLDGKPLSMGERAALFAGAIMRQGRIIDLRPGQGFSYHSRDERLDKYKNDFAKIVEQMVEMLKRGEEEGVFGRY